MLEHETRLVPIEHREIAYAHNRPAAEKTPYPVVGQRVWYRHREWDEQVYEAEIVEVQDPGDRTDPWLWHAVRDNFTGEQLVDAGVPRFVSVADPWPWVVLRTEIDGQPRTFLTREGRVRGSAGWLPLDWRQRPVRLPSQLVMQALQPLAVPLHLPS